METLSFIARLCWPETTCHANQVGRKSKGIISFHIINPFQRSLFFIAGKTILMFDYKKPSRKNSKTNGDEESKTRKKRKNCSDNKNENEFSEFSTFETKELYQTVYLLTMPKSQLYQGKIRKSQANFSIHFSIDIYGAQSIYPYTPYT